MEVHRNLTRMEKPQSSSARVEHREHIGAFSAEFRKALVESDFVQL